MYAALAANLKRFEEVGIFYWPTLLSLLMTMLAIQSCDSLGCNRVWSSDAFPSPDGLWVARVNEVVCSGGLGSAVEKTVDVYLAQDPRLSATVLSPSGQWKDPARVKLHWVGSKLLEVIVPNRTVFDFQLSTYRDVQIVVRYENDDPVDRANWMGFVKKNAEWAASDVKAVQPQPPPPP